MKRPTRTVSLLALAVAACIGALAPTTARAAAPAGRYTLATDTVADTVTHLTWQRSVPTQTYTWAAATTYCQGLSLGGFTSGWRLPTVKELQSIVDPRAYNPSIDSTAFPATPSNNFWSSSPAAGSPGNAWIVGFYDGGTDGSGTGYPGQVRCVR